MRETEQEMINLVLRREYLNSIKHIYKFWEENYHSYFEVGVVLLTNLAKSDPDTFFHKNTHDLMYTSLKVNFVKAFMSAAKMKTTGKMCAMSNMQKYKDAII